jgi:hypothetical protein
MVDAAIEGLDDATLAQRPSDQCNSIAWILWHMNRVVDTFVHTRFRALPQLWSHDGWYRKFNMANDPNDRGVGWTAGQVAAWRSPGREALVGYYHAVRAAARDYLSSVSTAELETRKVIAPVAEPRTVANALGQMVWDMVAHGGQIAYLRGYYRGMGWHR